METLISQFPDDYKDFFRNLIEYTISLGYNLRFNSKITSADFIKSKHGKTIMRIGAYGDLPALCIRFDGLPVCSGIFQEAAIYSKEHGFCKQCNRCDGSKGIKYKLSDGSVIVGSCQSIRDIPTYIAEDFSLIKETLKIQDEYLIKLYAKS